MVRRRSSSSDSSSSDGDSPAPSAPAADATARGGSPEPATRNDRGDEVRGRDRRDDSPPRRRHRGDSPPQRRHRGDSPPRRRHRDYSPPRRRPREDSPPRRHTRDDSPPRRRSEREERGRPDGNAERPAENGPAARMAAEAADDAAPAPAEPAAVAERPAKPAGPAGGVYIPPFKLAQMMRDAEDKEGKEFQRMTWDALRKSINGLVNKVNITNIKDILPEFFGENLVRGRGLLCRSMMKSQMASPTFTPVYAALVAVINTKFPELGELLLHRLLKQWMRAYTRNDKPVVLAVTKFIAHLTNQQVVHELLVLEMLLTLLERPSDSSIEVAVSLAKEVGAFLQDVAPAPANHVYDRFRHVMHEGDVDKRVQYIIEALFLVRKTGFEQAGFPAVPPELDLVDTEDQITHEVSTKETMDAKVALDVFKYDPDYTVHESEYEAIKREVLGEDEEEEGSEGEEGESSDEDSDEEEEGAAAAASGMGFGGAAGIKDMTETELINLRRTIYLTIMSSLDFEEAGHKLMKIDIPPGKEIEMVTMVLECCSQEKTYIRYYGLLAQRFCYIKREYQEVFEDCFRRQYGLIHRLETNKLRNVAKFFAHLLTTDAISWVVLSNIVLTEEATTSSARIFIKILFQELSETMGLSSLNARLQDPLAIGWVAGIFPKDTPRNMRFSINFFTSIGLGGLTDDMREHLKNLPKLIMQQQAAAAAAAAEASSSSSDSSSSDSDSSSSSSSSSSDSSSSDSDSDSDSGKKQKLPPPPSRRQQELPPPPERQKLPSPPPKPHSSDRGRRRSPESVLATPHRDGSPRDSRKHDGRRQRAAERSSGDNRRRRDRASPDDRYQPDDPYQAVHDRSGGDKRHEERRRGERESRRSRRASRSASADSAEEARAHKSSRRDSGRKRGGSVEAGGREEKRRRR